MKLHKNFIQLQLKVIHRIKYSFKLSKLSKSLMFINNQDFNDWIKIIENLSKKKLSLKLKDEWEDYFNKYKEKYLKLKSEIGEIEAEIDNKVYEIYNLTKDQIKVIEEWVK